MFTNKGSGVRVVVVELLQLRGLRELLSTGIDEPLEVGEGLVDIGALLVQELSRAFYFCCFNKT